MMRPSVVVVTVSMFAACGGLAYLHATRELAMEKEAAVNEPQPISAAARPSVPAATPANSTEPGKDEVTQATPNAGETASNEPVATPDNIAQWIKDTESPEAKVRAAAIAALATAPKDQAMPALERVVEVGEPNVDRHIALRSMHSLALRDGDANGQVRDAIRHAIYHGDDDGVTQTAQSLLDDIEAEFAEREQDVNQAREP